MGSGWLLRREVPGSLGYRLSSASGLPQEPIFLRIAGTNTEGRPILGNRALPEGLSEPEEPES
ncbi:hypothetical protein D3C75_1033540 [compost metagenome]